MIATVTEWQEMSSRILIPSQEPPKETKSTEDRKQSLPPTLDWFKSLPVEKQEKIWTAVRKMLIWSGHIESDFSGRECKPFFDALREAGAEWCEYT